MISQDSTEGIKARTTVRDCGKNLNGPSSVVSHRVLLSKKRLRRRRVCNVIHSGRRRGDVACDDDDQQLEVVSGRAARSVISDNSRRLVSFLHCAYSCHWSYIGRATYTVGKISSSPKKGLAAGRPFPGDDSSLSSHQRRHLPPPSPSSRVAFRRERLIVPLARLHIAPSDLMWQRSPIRPSSAASSFFCQRVQECCWRFLFVSPPTFLPRCVSSLQTEYKPPQAAAGRGSNMKNCHLLWY